MTKTFMTLGILALVIITLASCSRLLRPTAGTQRRNRPGNKNIFKDSTETGENSKNPVYNTGAFTGKIVKDVVYATATNNRGANEQLDLDVYKPANADGKKFPVIFLDHGGSFLGGNKANLSSTCSKLANNGYVVISINYRLGWATKPVSRKAATCSSDTNLLKHAIYRAIQDTHSAMRFVAAHAAEYNADKNWFFVGGQSAGAITALFTAYLKEKDADGFFPGYDKDLGVLDLQENDANAAYKLKGVISMWGAFANPDLITSSTALPTIFFQGVLDQAVPFYSRPFTPCPTNTVIYGTYPLYKRLKDLNETAIAHVDPQGGHGVFEEDFRVNNILCFLNDVKQGVTKQVYVTGVQNSCDK